VTIGSILGHPVLRTEDPGLLRGEALFVDDLPCEGAMWAAFVRSPFAHARVHGVDPSEATAMPGVAGVFTAHDLDVDTEASAGETEGGTEEDEAEEAYFARPLLAHDVVRFAGEPVAVVLAASREQAADAAEAVLVDYEPLPSVTDPDAALAPGAPLLFPEHGSNVATERTGGDPAALEGSEVVVRRRFVNQRVAPVPMEPNGALVAPAAEGLLAWLPVQIPFTAREELASATGLPEDAIRVVVPAVGGGFGAKAEASPEHLAVAILALRLGRPVRWMETRSENLVAMTHGRAQIQEVAIGATRDGQVVGLELRVVGDMGAYPQNTWLPSLTRQMAVGTYRIPKVRTTTASVVTNTTPVAAYRGAGRPEATALLERAMDILAAELGIDPVELRRRNLIAPDAFPYRTPTGLTYDVGDYGRALDEALRLAGYDDLRADQASRRARGDRRQLGIGVACYVEITGWQGEFGSVEVHLDGTATARTGTTPHGQGHETAWAQIVAGTLRVPFASIRVVHSDTGAVPRGNGTAGSRSLQIGGSAVRQAGEEVVEQARRVAGHLLEAAPEDVVQFDDGGFGVAGVPDISLSWAELARAVEEGGLPEGIPNALAAGADFKQRGNTFPFGAHVSVVEVDVETGRVTPLRHIAVDDCGRILNPMLVDGQVHGGIGQGLAQALYEEVGYDEDGNPSTSSLLTYEMPSAADVPPFEAAHTETPTPLNPLGAKGIGESATIGSTPAVQNAVVDAVAHLGVRHIDLPLTPERVWRAIRAAREEA
jgi:carbon-monoxide dehydrogenase large subunit